MCVFTSLLNAYVFVVGIKGLMCPCLKEVPPLACCNFDTHEQILIFFGRNTADKVSNPKMLYYASASNNLSALPGKMGNMKIAFFSRCISALPEFNQLLLDFFSLFDL